MAAKARRALTSIVGSSAGLQVHVIESIVRPGDIILLTTDGIHESLDDCHLCHLLLRRTDPAHAAADLVAAAIGSGSSDNCTAVVARF